MFVYVCVRARAGVCTAKAVCAGGIVHVVGGACGVPGGAQQSGPRRLYFTETSYWLVTLEEVKLVPATGELVSRERNRLVLPSHLTFVVGGNSC